MWKKKVCIREAQTNTCVIDIYIVQPGVNLLRQTLENWIHLLNHMCFSIDAV